MKFLQTICFEELMNNNSRKVTTVETGSCSGARTSTGLVNQSIIQNPTFLKCYTVEHLYKGARLHLHNHFDVTDCPVVTPRGTFGLDPAGSP